MRWLRTESVEWRPHGGPMKHFVSVVALLITAVAFSQDQTTKPVLHSFVAIRAGVLIDGKSDQPRSNQIIIIRGNVIDSISDAATAHIPQGAQIIDLTHATVLPGMIDSHTHIMLQGEDPAAGGYDINLFRYPLSYRVALATVAVRRALEQGFTTLRDVETEGAGYSDIGIKQAINGGFIPGPRLFVSTLGISTTGGYEPEDTEPELKIPKGVQLIDGPVEARKAAREQLDHGADWIKIYTTHRSWVGKNGELVSQPTLTLEEIKAITDEVHGWGKKVACHAYGGTGLHRALDGGCDSIEHGLDLDDAAVSQMVKEGIWYVPTLGVYYEDNAPPDTSDGKRDKARVDAHEVSFKKALKAGVKIAFGTDMGGISWTKSIADEFGYMVKFGMSPMQAIKSV